MSLTMDQEIELFNSKYMYTGSMDDFVKISHIMDNLSLNDRGIDHCDPCHGKTYLSKWMNSRDIDDDVTIQRNDKEGKFGCFYLYKYTKVNKTLKRRQATDEEIKQTQELQQANESPQQLLSLLR